MKWNPFEQMILVLGKDSTRDNKLVGQYHLWAVIMNYFLIGCECIFSHKIKNIYIVLFYSGLSYMVNVILRLKENLNFPNDAIFVTEIH